jgi:hypothetical protein
MERIAVCVNPAKLLASLPRVHQQVHGGYGADAKRAPAKASYVALDYDGKAQTLTVRDDGVGIVEWQKLFTVGESDGCDHRLR